MRLLKKLFVTGLILVSGPAMSQGAVDVYPSKPVALILPFSAGGPTEVIVRLYATRLAELMGQPFLIDYKPGAGGTLGAAFVAKARPDGYTLLGSGASFTAGPALYKDLPFDTVKDFTPIFLMSQSPFVLVSSAVFPAKTFAEYLAFAKANPGKINLGTSGASSTQHLLGAWLHSATNSKVTFVHYKGAGPQVIELLAGRLDVGLFPALLIAQHVKTGKLRALAMTDVNRSKLLPDIPSIADQGIPEFHYTLWTGALAPAATPAAIVSKLGDAFARASRAADIAATLEAQDAVPSGGQNSAAQLAKIIITETVLWRRLVRENDIKAEGG